MDTIAARLKNLRSQIDETCQACGRTTGGVRVLAVSKMQTAATIEQACRAGQREFAENYWQELEQKQRELSDQDIVWHFIGSLQSRKAKAMANNVEWVHSIARVKTALALHKERSIERNRLNVCIQVGLYGERQKNGIALDDLPALIEEIDKLERLALRGLMTVLPIGLRADEAQTAYQRLSKTMANLRDEGLDVDTLSMGMSGDWRAAVSAGSTIVRLGTAIFGSRQTGKPSA